MIQILYNYLPDHRGIFSYRLIICLTEQGPVSLEVLWNAYCEQHPEVKGGPHGEGKSSGERELNFKSLSDLQQFSLLLLEKLGLKHCYLLSRDAYNEGIDTVGDREQFQQIFAKYGDVVINHKLKSKIGLLFEKFFQ